jgi:imidazolonepropionase-like amidohydrolase
MKKAGIKMGVGTDLTTSLYKHMPEPYIIELNNFKKAGYSNIEAMVAATKTNAEILGMDDRIGTIEVGKLADVIIVNGKPDESIEDIAKVKTVIVNGKIKVRNGNTIMAPREKLSMSIK